MWKVIKNIIIGWCNYFRGYIDPTVIKRRKICKKCLSNNQNFCAECGCYIPAKTTVKDEECKLNKW